MEKATKKSRTDDFASNKSNTILTLLDQNSLLQVLLRTCCEDHHALRQTCRLFQSIMDSPLFRQERAQQEWAQVEVQVLTAREHYEKDANQDKDDDDEDDSDANNDFYFRHCYCELGWMPEQGAIQNEFRILVDGKVGGSGSFTLIQRNGTNHFHATCDGMSKDLRDTSCLFFNSRGRPRLASLKEAMKMVDGNDVTRKRDYFIYLDTFKLNPEHRLNNATWVGSKAIRSLLLDSPLKDKWSVAIYIGDADANFTEQDEKRSAAERENVFAAVQGWKRDEEALQEEVDWKERLNSLAKNDLRPFLRCGFQQAVDSVQKSNCFYAFAVPAFLSHPMLSHTESLAVNIVDKKRLPSSGDVISAVDSKLLGFMMTSCSKRKDLYETLWQKQATSPQTREMIGMQFDRELDEQFRSIRNYEQQVPQCQETLNSTREYVRSIASQPGFSNHMKELGESKNNKMQSDLNDLAAKIAKMKETLESMRSKREAMIEESFRDGVSAHAEALASARTALAKHDSEVKAEVANMVGRNNDRASVKNSNALHACAANMIPEYVDLLLEFVPDAERLSVLNKRDSAGLTPLMVVAATSFGIPECIQVAEKLIDLGADKGLTDASGETALGKFRGMKRSTTDFSNMVRFQRGGPDTNWDREHARMEQLLRPFGGPTAADDAYLESSDHDDDEDDGDDDDNDDDDDDDASEFESDGDEDQVGEEE